ncbi:NAD-dependent epimerase/dehydratase family protein [Jatrophihabitans sp. YIM 134969]
MTSQTDALVVGAGGFLGGHLVRSLLLQGLRVRAVDARPVEGWLQVHDGADNRRADLAQVENAVAVTSGVTTVYDLAAAASDAPRVDRMTGVLADTHLLQAARDTGVDRYVVGSSAVDVPPALAAASPDDRCWRHLFTERMARHFHEDFGLQTRIVRLGPLYGPRGGDAGPVAGRAVVTTVVERTAIAVAERSRTVEIPYRAEDPASQVYVDDAVLGLQLVAHGADSCGPHVVVDPDPLPVAAVVQAVLAAAGAHAEPVYTAEYDVPRVIGDTSALVETLDWEPDIPLAATLHPLWAAASRDVRRGPDRLPSVSDRWTHRRSAVPSSAHPVRTTSRVVGRHRYENAG